MRLITAARDDRRLPSRTDTVRRGVMLTLVSMLMMMATTTTTTPADAFAAHPSTCRGGRGVQPSLPVGSKTTSTAAASQLQASSGDAASPQQKPQQSPRRPASAADFERQELKAQIQAMKDQGVAPSNLNMAKRDELEGYVRAVVSKRPSLVPLGQLGDVLPGTRWRLAFTTQSAMAETLPRDVTIRMAFVAREDNDDDSNLMDYSLDFAKTLGLKRINARSTYTVDSSPANPGLVSIIYDAITTDVFGLKNLGVGMFGMLKGRATYIPTAYFDGSIWIERGVSSGAATGGEEYYNVYAREEE